MIFTTIPLLTCLIFAMIYPLCFWISFQDPLKNKFHKFHVGIANFVGGVAVVWALLIDISFQSKCLILIWKAVLLSTSRYVWKKEYPNPLLMTVPCVIGLGVFSIVQKELVAPGWPITFIGILAGVILCSSIFAMNLGHWYLNVHGLPIHHLLRAVYVFWFFLIIRAIWDIKFLFLNSINFHGEFIPVTSFLFKMDGILLTMALLFGTFFPMISLYFVKETLKVKSTQSATGILYVILIAVLIGDLTYKFYLIKYGIVL